VNVDVRLEAIKTKLAERVKDVASCFQCGTCVAACPVCRLTGGESYHPRRFVRATLEGKARELLDDPGLWLCTSCHACFEHCPQCVPVSELIQDLQNLACEMGMAPVDVAAEVENILKTGWALAPSEAVNQRREAMGLPPIPLDERNGRDLQKIAKATELQRRLDKIKNRQETEEQSSKTGEESL
jgi:heterodisulfide reductase subunit C